MADTHRRARNNGKCAERRVAKFLGTTRWGPTGLNTNDIKHDRLAVEIKYRSKLPAWALTCLDQARTAQTAIGKIPVVILLAKGMKAKDGIVVMQMNDLLAIVGEFCQQE